MIKKFSCMEDSTAEVFFANATVADDTAFPCYWARPIIGEVRQIAVVKWEGGRYSFLDNKDGSALIKFQEGWWPNRPHRGMLVKETVEELLKNALPESQWNEYSQAKFIIESKRLNNLEEEFYSGNAEYEKLKGLKAYINKQR